jgi:uncharacterized protein YdbL (DUF1318 family)
MKPIPALILIALLPAACAPTVRLDTPEPVKIDVNMKVEVVTKDGGSAPASGAKKEDPATLSPQERRRLRMAEVQSLKNDRLVGEGQDGLLHIVTRPADASYLAYAEKVVADENGDRRKVFEAQARSEGRPEARVAREFAERSIGGAFPGEWVQNADGKWVKQ